VSGNTKEGHEAWWGGGSGDEGGERSGGVPGAGFPTGSFIKHIGGRVSVGTRPFFSDAGETACGGPAGPPSGSPAVRSARRPVRPPSGSPPPDGPPPDGPPPDGYPGRSVRAAGGGAKKTHGFIQRRHHHRFCRPVKKNEREVR
jgi:hypothetical protein